MGSFFKWLDAEKETRVDKQEKDQEVCWTNKHEDDTMSSFARPLIEYHHVGSQGKAGEARLSRN